jgi:hypothetical protein
LALQYAIAAALSSGVIARPWSASKILITPSGVAASLPGIITFLTAGRFGSVSGDESLTIALPSRFNL